MSETALVFPQTARHPQRDRREHPGVLFRRRERNGEGEKRRLRDVRVAQIAGRQFGVISREQLRASGLDSHAVARRMQRGRLHPLFANTWAVGHVAIPREAWFQAALLEAGPGSALSHHSACQHRRIWNGRLPEVHVAIAGPRQRHQGAGPSRPALRIHRLSPFPPVQEVEGLQTVATETCLVQFAITEPLESVRRAAREAQVLRLTTHERLLAAAAGGGRGTRRLREALSGGPAPTRNAGEDAALAFLRECGLGPLVNHRLYGFEVDFYLPEHALVIEFDGRGVHDIALVTEDDRRRQGALEARGLRFLRLDWRDVTVRRAEARRRVLAATT